MNEQKTIEKKTFYKKWWFFLIILIVIIVGIDVEKSEIPSLETPSPKVKNVAKIGDVLKTDYFDVTLLNAESTKNRLCNNTYINGCKAPQDGEQYIVLNLKITNTDNKARILLSQGILYGNLNGKEYTFDKAVVIFENGFLDFVNSINPLLSLQGKVVFRISEQFKLSELSYKPSQSNQVIQLSR